MKHFDAIRFLNDFNIEWISRGANVGTDWVGVDCPFCRDVGYHGGFNLYDGHYYCWKCGWHSTFDVIKIYTGRQDYETRQIEDEYGDRRYLLESLNVHDIEHPSSLSMPGTELDFMCKKYLKKRNFDPVELEAKYHLRSGGIIGDWAYRIIIPIFYKKNLVSYIGRDTSNKQKIRYKNLSIEKSVMDPKTVLYNIDNCTEKDIVVVEGSFDVMRWGDNCCATLGTTVTEPQIRMLKEFRKVFVLFDNDEAGEDKAYKVAQKVSAMGTDVEVVNHGWDHDLGSASKDEVDWLKKELEFS